MTADGRALKAGGPGTVFSDFRHDLDRSSGRGRDETSGTADDCGRTPVGTCFGLNRADLTITFGAPGFYRASRPGLRGDRPDPDDSDGQRRAARGAIGEYWVWLSNHADLACSIAATFEGRLRPWPCIAGERSPKRRDEIERSFQRPKGYHPLFTRFGKRGVMLRGFILFAFITDALR